MELFLLDAPQGAGSGIDLNINDLINELKGIYDTLKYQKSQLNRNIRTLNNAYSRKNRKENEYKTYSERAKNIKENLVSSSKEAYDKVGYFSTELESYFTDVVSDIQSLEGKVDFLKNSGTLTLSQKAAFDTYDRFSSEVKSYISNYKNELKGEKYETLEKFLTDSTGKSPLSEEKFGMDIYNKITKVIESMDETLGQLVILGNDSDKKEKMWNVDLGSLYSDINSDSELLQILENLLSDTNSKLANANVDLQNAIQSEADPAVIKELTEVKSKLEEKMKSLSAQKDKTIEIISALQTKANSLEEERNVYRSYYSSEYNKYYNDIYQLRSQLNDNTYQLYNKYNDYYSNNFGHSPAFEISLAKAQAIANMVGHGSLYNIVGIIDNYKRENSTYTVNNLSLRGYLGFANSDVTNANGWVYPSEYKNRQSFSLDVDKYSFVQDYFNQLAQYNYQKSSISILNDKLSDARDYLDTFYKQKDSISSDIAKTKTNISEIESKLQTFNDDINRLYNDLYALDSNSDTYLEDWTTLKNAIRDNQTKASLIGSDLDNLYQHIGPKGEELSFIEVTIDNKENEISSMDDSIREINNNMLQTESNLDRMLKQYFSVDSSISNTMSQELFYNSFRNNGYFDFLYLIIDNNIKEFILNTDLLKLGENFGIDKLVKLSGMFYSDSSVQAKVGNMLIELVNGIQLR
jgi:chromosome segregation ATPase